MKTDTSLGARGGRTAARASWIRSTIPASLLAERSEIPAPEEGRHLHSMRLKGFWFAVEGASWQLSRGAEEGSMSNSIGIVQYVAAAVVLCSRSREAIASGGYQQRIYLQRLEERRTTRSVLSDLQQEGTRRQYRAIFPQLDLFLDRTRGGGCGLLPGPPSPSSGRQDHQGRNGFRKWTKLRSVLPAFTGQYRAPVFWRYRQVWRVRLRTTATFGA